MSKTITVTTKIPTKAQRNAPKQLTDKCLAFRYVNLLKAGTDDGNETAFLEDEMRFRWLAAQGIDLKKALSEPIK